MDLDAFVRDGYVVIRGAFGAGTAAACRELIWSAMAERGVRRDDPATWPPVMEFANLVGEPFAEAGLAPALTAAYDELIGPGRWRSPVDVGGAVVVRGPAENDRGNAGYHIEGSYTGPDGTTGWVDIRSRARGLLALFLFTDVGADDAPTRLLCGSHRYVPEFLAPYGEAGTDSDTEFWRPSVLCLRDAHATGAAGDVFLCHPFIVHTATWPHRGPTPRMIAQPAVNAPDGFVLDGSDPSPVARAIVEGLTLAGHPLIQRRRSTAGPVDGEPGRRRRIQPEPSRRPRPARTQPRRPGPSSVGPASAASAAPPASSPCP